ncbi:MAG: amidohydrolase family protein [Pseudomonadota bacterium]
MPLPALTAFREKHAHSASPLPQVIAGGLVRVSGASPHGGAEEDPVEIEAAADLPDTLRRMKDGGVDFLKVHGPISPDTYEAVAATARELGLPFAGDAGLRQSLDDIAAAGQQTIEHNAYGFHGCGPDTEDYLGRAAAARLANNNERVDQVYVSYVSNLDWQACAPVLRRLAAAGVAWTPTLGIDIGFADFIDPAVLESFPSDSVCGRVRDSLREAGLEAEQDLYDAAVTVLSNLNAAGVTLLAGTGSPESCLPHGRALPWEIQMLSALGLSRVEALRAATVNPANVFGYADDYGRIEQGYAADIVFYDVSPAEDLQQLSAPSGLYTKGRYLSAAELAGLRTAG